MGETTKIQKGKVPAKRNSEARREQNRLASRNYREKRKQKLALLNELLEPSNLPSITGNGHIDDVPGPSGSSDTGAPPLQGQTLSSAPLTNHLIPLDLNRFDGNGTYFVPQTWEDSTQESVPTVISNQLVQEFLPVLNKGNPSSLGSHDQWEAVMPGVIQQSSTFTGQPPADYMGYRSIEEVFEDSPDSDHSGSQGASRNDDGFLKDVLHGVESLSIEQKRSLLRHLQQDTREPKSLSSSQKMLHQTPGQLQAIRFAKALYKTANARPSLFPAQYTMEPGIFGAIFANCYALGMGGVDEILHDDGCSVFSVTPDEGHHPSKLSFVKSRFLDVSSDLQPIEKQLTFGHHPYIDVIPFKTFRENLITVLDQDPNAIDEGALCHDILSGGFTCWGAGRNSHGMGAGVPWDSRSWEPSIWFLMKYRALAGEWDGELWKSARWWHSARGERIQISQEIDIGSNMFQGTPRR
ncbi:hypothetical protein DER46DRAFT_594193 [Fusarium sp. MPI-SDFR-AT-0072]|uniref:BZIP domain-containing protein n=1 Tax=Fusarium oxysporum f. sp. rapae TaxID=485398 RepID=A0A8J5UFK3_FUSOX|nr:hypothetical protein Forpe1208_v002857 [Fusarium oxysporum f. sp. rapae]KAH7172199.1 hypothetical protein DER46DRAFT_594193 [Fusarium sp. MPI-SDFR-AT-0072]KAI7769179.1 hypothetical protein LZL87_000726 [Fusarium oxysporum]